MEMTASAIIALGLALLGGFAWLIRLEAKATDAKTMVKEHIDDDGVHYNRDALKQEMRRFEEKFTETNRKLDKFDQQMESIGRKMDAAVADFHTSLMGVTSVTSDIQRAVDSLRKTHNASR